MTKLHQEEMVLLIGKTYRFRQSRRTNVYGPRQSLSNPYAGVAEIWLSRLPSIASWSSSRTADSCATSSRSTTSLPLVLMIETPAPTSCRSTSAR
jgi:hypothetical protein